MQSLNRDFSSQTASVHLHELRSCSGSSASASAESVAPINCPDCGKQLKSVMALNAHLGKCPNKQTRPIKSSKLRWSEEEIRVCISTEYEFKKKGLPDDCMNKFISLKLWDTYKFNRTTDAVRNKRRDPTYIVLRDQFFEGYANIPQNSMDDSYVEPVDAPIPETLTELFQDLCPSQDEVVMTEVRALVEGNTRDHGEPQRDQIQISASWDQAVADVVHNTPVENTICPSWDAAVEHVRVDPQSTAELQQPTMFDLKHLDPKVFLAGLTKCYEHPEGLYKKNPDQGLIQLCKLATQAELPSNLMDKLDSHISKWGKSIPKQKNPVRQMNYWVKKALHKANSHTSKRAKRKGPKAKTIIKTFEYKRDKAAWKEDRAKFARNLLDSCKAGKDPSEIEGFKKHWSSTYKKEASPMEIPQGAQLGQYNVWYGISMKELKQQLGGMDNKSATGPDGITVTELKRSKLKVLLLLNSFIILGKVPPILKRSRTTFIPKKDGASLPKEFRPISVSSCILRLFNNILAKRMLSVAPLDDRQRGFRPVDGTCENIMSMQALIDIARREKRSLYLANLDMTNAYGSVHHDALFQCLSENGASEQMCDYIRDLYTDFRTKLQVGKRPLEVQVQRGVVQGDPLSCILFNIVMERVIKAMPQELGFHVEDHVMCNGMAFADDMTAVSASPSGLQIILNAVEKAGKPLGLSFNASKCQYLGLEAVGGKKIELKHDLDIRISGGKLPGVKEGEHFRYLGAHFNEKGLVRDDEKIVRELVAWLTKVKKCRALLPQHKLYIIRYFIQPRLIFRLSMEMVDAGLMNRCDKIIRSFLVGKHGILHLHGKTPKPFFYVTTGGGGIGLLSFRLSIPPMIHRRFGRLRLSKCKLIRILANGKANQMRLDKVERLFKKTGKNKTEVKAYIREKLYSMHDGRNLRHFKKVPHASNWVLSGSSKELTGRDYCTALALRSNTLMTKERAGRGIPGYSKCCRYNCLEKESQHHILSKCARVKDAHTKRHDFAKDKLAKMLRGRGFVVETEKQITTSRGKLIPDIVAFKKDTVYVLDVAVRGGPRDPEERVKEKIDKYNTSEVGEHLDKLWPDSLHVFMGIVFTTNGCIAESSDRLLRNAMGMSKNDILHLVITAMKGSIMVYNVFQRPPMHSKKHVDPFNMQNSYRNRRAFNNRYNNPSSSGLASL